MAVTLETYAALLTAVRPVGAAGGVVSPDAAIAIPYTLTGCEAETVTVRVPVLPLAATCSWAPATLLPELVS